MRKPYRNKLLVKADIYERLIAKGIPIELIDQFYNAAYAEQQRRREVIRNG